MAVTLHIPDSITARLPEGEIEERLRLELVIERRIYLIRGHKVMLDTDLAVLYQVQTFNFNKAVKRNLGRFPMISCFN